ncbi:MAG: tRNA (adenosine(37)-N6)-threonylcarbamoyltransferase complex transferase subunit TsaD [Patescibacteria group bacterium]|nr:tRNA (adenosine(37)-N6)-threonylcarbamoyltransferase complex transferase subunit TsaD [Patescibacteria group bacterium]
MDQPKIILGIESSCDETAAAVMQKTNSGVQILSNIVASSAQLQSKYGGIIPEQAAREQLKSIIPVIQEALLQANLHSHPEPIRPEGSRPRRLDSGSKKIPDQVHNDKESISSIDAIAVTQGPGLIGSLLVGVETAKTLALVWKKPLIPVHHLLGHFYANWINSPSLRDHKVAKQSISEIAALSGKSRFARNDNTIPSFPCLGLLISGGHTDLVLLKGHGKYQYLGGTRDDAAGECFDKCARLMGLAYPGGPEISKLAQKGNPKAFKLPRPMIDSGDFDFSFSGLKTAVANLIQKEEVKEFKQNTQLLADLAAAIEEAIADVLIEKTIAAARKYNVEQIVVAGGVAANKTISSRLIKAVEQNIARGEIFIPPVNLCTDNAAYIAAAAFYNYHPISPFKLQANPNLSLSY